MVAGPHPRGTFPGRRTLTDQGGSATMGGELAGKPVRAITGTDVGGREASLIQRCAARDEDACAELVAEHQRMGYQLSLDLLNDHNGALDPSQDAVLPGSRAIQ